MMKRKFMQGIGATIIIAGGIIAGSYYYLDYNSDGLGFDTYTVTTGDIVVEVKVSGEATLLNEQQLSFGQEGKVTKVLAEVGDRVKAGQVLAELDLDVYNNNVKNAELQLANAKLQLQKLLNNDTSLAQSQIRSKIDELYRTMAIEEEQYDILEQQLDQSLQQKINLLSQRQEDVVIASQSLENANQELLTNVDIQAEQNQEAIHASAQTINDSKADIAALLDDVEKYIREVDKIFAYSADYSLNDDQYGVYLSARDSSLKTQTISAISHSYTIIAQQKRALDTLGSTAQALEEYIVDLYDDLEVIVLLTATAGEAVDASIISRSYTEQTIAAHAASIASARTGILGLRESLNIMRSGVANTLSDELQQDSFDNNVAGQVVAYRKQQVALENLQEDIALLEKEITTQQADKNNQLQRQQTTIDTIKNNIGLAKEELQDLLDGADSYDINQAKNAVKQAEIAISTTQKQKEDFQLIAEFDGRIRSIDMTAGEQYKFEDRKFIVVENPDLIELELTVSQIDIVDMKEGNPVLITFDAYPKIAIAAVIDTINVNPIINQRGGTSYKATVLVEKQDITIYAGMTALAVVTVQEKRDVLVVPSLAIDEINGEHYVYVISDDNAISTQAIDIGMSDNFLTEVVSGLESGDRIRASVITQEDFTAYGITAEGDSLFGGE